MKINPELDKGYFLSTCLNILFVVGLFFISQLENLIVLILYVVLMGLNSIYLVIKAAKIRYNKPGI
ncbi:hypothetical protein [Mammaliicoccus vitulinus]|uniref:hypothetical protein n=1 Tax=Mammaliicoccus vitulinus TaxID=71237 RepID=UPI003B9E0274